LKANTSKNKFLYKANLKNFIATAQAAHLLLPQHICQPKGESKRVSSPTLYSAS